jgi:hypothetical protein
MKRASSDFPDCPYRLKTGSLWVTLGVIGTLERVLSSGWEACSGGALFAGKVAIAERGEEAFKRLFCAFVERIGKRGGKGRGRGGNARL